MFRPAGDSDDYDSDDFEGLDIGAPRRVRERHVPAAPAASTAESLQRDRDLNVIDIIANGRLDDLDVLCSKPDFKVDDLLLYNWSPLIHACQCAQYNAVDILLAAGAKPNLFCNGTAPLIEACSRPSDPEIMQNIVALLLHKGAAVNVSNRFGRSPLMFTCMTGNMPVVTQLLQSANLAACDNDGNSALFYAIEYKYFDIVQLLLERGSSTEVRNNEGFKAKDWAIHVGFDRIEELIPTVVQYMLPNELSYYQIPADFAPTALQSEQPAFFPDVMSMLQVLGSDSLLENFATSKISLMEFLTLTDERIEELGAVYPFQRNRIMCGLQKFHLNPWSPRSLKVFKETDTTFDLFYTIAGLLKQMLILECTLNYVSRNEFKHNENTIEHIEHIACELQKIISDLKQIRKVTEKIHQRAVHPPLLVSGNCLPPKSSYDVSLTTILKYSTVLAACGVCFKWVRDAYFR